MYGITVCQKMAGGTWKKKQSTRARQVTDNQILTRQELSPLLQTSSLVS